MADNEDEQWQEGDGYDAWYDDEWGPMGGVEQHAVTGTQTQTITMTAAGSAGDGNGGSRRPPRPESNGGAASAAGSASQRRDKRPAPGGGGGGGGGGNGDPNGGDGDPRRHALPRPRRVDASDSEVERGPRKKEGEECKFPTFPSHASGFQAWLDAVLDIIVACARDGDAAFAWIAPLLREGITFEQLAIIAAEFKSLDSKIRAGVSKHLVGAEAEKHKDLVSVLCKRRDELREPGGEAMPKQITGLQYLWVIKHYFRIHDDERVTYELSALMNLEYAGDAKLGSWKNQWDRMVRKCVTKLTDRDKFSMFSDKLKTSDRLKSHMEYLERLQEDHPDRSYAWLSDLVDKLVADDRKRKNKESLVLEASGKPQAPPKKQPGAPGPRKRGDADANTPAAPGVTGGGKPGSDGKGKGKGKGKKGDGKGPGKNQGSWSDGGNTDAESDPKGKGNPKKKTEEYPGKKVEDIPKDQRCCIHYCWVKKDGTSFCYKFNKGIQCHAPHLVKPTKAMMETKVYNRLKDQHGPPNCPAGGPKAPEKKN